MLEYIDNIIVPYESRKKQELGLPDNHHGLIIYDEFQGQMLLQNEHHFDIILVPPQLH